MSRVFRVYDLGKNKVGEMFSLGESRTGWDGWTKNWYFFATRYGHHVLGVVGTGIYNSDDYEHVLELRAYPSGAERQCSWFL